MFVPTTKPMTLAFALKLVAGFTSDPTLPVPAVITMFLALMFGASILTCVLVVVCSKPALMPDSSSDSVP